MKRIIINPLPPEHVIFAKDLPTCPIIGTSTRHGPQTKGFVQQIEPRNPDSYQITVFRDIMHGARYHNVLFGGTLAQALSHPDLDYFLFNTEKELFEWLLKE
jgi:hypothetical protein